MMKFKIGLSHIEYNSKPTDVKRLNKTIKATEVDITSLAEALAKGQTITPCYFTNDKRDNNHFLGTSVFALDFDDNQNPEDKLGILKQYGIHTNIYYPTFSDTPQHRKFRLVIVFDEVISNKKIRDKIQLALMEIVKDSDKACKDAARIFYGSNTSEIIEPKPNVLQDCYIHLQNIINSQSSSTTKTKIDKMFEKNAPSYSILRDCGKIKDFPIKRNYDFNKACETSKVLNYFAKGGHLSYALLFNLISNMRYIEGGLKWVEEKMDLSNTYEKCDYEILRTIKKYNYLPSNIDSFDESLIGLYSNIYSLDRASNKIDVIKRSKKKNSDELYSNFSLELERISNKGFLENIGVKIPRINVINVGVGIGKSHKLKKLLRQGKTVFAFPTHELKKEFEQDIIASRFPYEVTPETPVFIDDQINKQYRYYQSIGDTSKANGLIKEVASRDINEELYTDVDDVITAREYLNNLEAAYNSPHSILTTHTRALLTPSSFKDKDHFVFDEDIFETLLPIEQIKSSDVRRAIELFSKNKMISSVTTDLKTIYDYLNSLTNKVIEPTKNIALISLKSLIKDLCSVKGGEKIIRFIESDFILRYKSNDDVDNLYFIKKTSLPTDKQITIASATADEFFYDKLLGKENYKYTFLGKAKNKKPIIQYTSKRYSKNALTKDDLPIINKESTVITYKDYKEKFPHSDEVIHFGNSEGYNHLKGKNISIVGTPIKPIQIVMLYAKILGIDFEDEDLEFNRRPFVYKGQGVIFKYNIHTYKNDELANIDVRLAMKELEQSTGRSRANRTDSETEVFSPIPIPLADIFELKKIG